MMNEIVSINIAAWLACAGFIVWIANGCLALVEKIRPKPSPDEVRLEAAKQYVTVEQFEAREALASENRNLMYKKMDDMRVELSNEIRAVNQRVDELSAEIRTVPATVVRMISEAKKI
jgi:hypothetical protein